MTSGSETSRTSTSRACLEDAAAAAVRARSRLVGRGELLASGRSGISTVASRPAACTRQISLVCLGGGRWMRPVGRVRPCRGGRGAVEAVLVDVAGDPVGDQV